jgi:peptide/nickel transport system permease protein
MKRVILVTGPIGSGRAFALRRLAESGYSVVDAEALAQHVLSPGQTGYAQILQLFGDGILAGSGEIDRLKLSRSARADPRASAAVRAILHAGVQAELEQQVRRSSSPFVFIKIHHPDAYGARGAADAVWLFSCTTEQRVENLVGEQGWPRNLAERLVASSPEHPLAEYAADLVLRTGGSPAGLWDQITATLHDLGWEPVGGAAITESEPALSPAATENFAAVQTAADIQEPPLGEASYAVEARPLPPVGFRQPDETQSERISRPSLRLKEIRHIARRLAGSLLILLAIAYLTSWGLILAEYGRQHLPIEPMRAAWQALGQTAKYILHHPATYIWAKTELPWLKIVGETLGHSAALLLLAMTAAILVGFPLGMAAARIRRGPGSSLIVLLSVVGASTPSFLVGMILWAANIWVHKTFNIKVLPATGFGWDAHVIMPVLVLAMRPIAQVAQITYISVRDALGQDYVRTAHSKGLTWRAVQNVHLMPNILIPILNTLGTSLRYSLASLPIVEVFFQWPGVGMRLLGAIGLGTSELVIDLILSLGLFFLLVNLLIEFSFPLIDPRLRVDAEEARRADSETLLGWVRQAWDTLTSWLRGMLVPGRRNGRSSLPALPSNSESQGRKLDAELPPYRRSVLRNTLRNPAFLLGGLLLLSLAALAVFGEKLPNVDPYQIHGVMSVGGEYSAPPFKTSPEFPWGSDHIGRDIRSLVLAGAGRTLTLVLFGMLGRMLVGTTLGLLAGWQRNSWFDRLVTSAMGVWAAFPATLFAMIVIQALGIQQGMWVFVVAIAFVGWGEVAQVVRAQVITLKPQAFMESARAIGARADQMLRRHILPNLANPLSVLAALEMGGILMLLAELGFLNIFMGGGFRAVIGEAGGMVPIVATYSDVPEWSALIANVRQYWRSYSWMALYPGAAIFVSIMAFNLFGEGLRRFLEDNAVAVGRLLNRYTLMAAAGAAVIFSLALRSSTPLNLYRAEGARFEDARVVQDIRVLSDPMLQGRETGTPGADLAAIYIAQRMAEIGLAPAGEHNSYYQVLVQPRTHLLALPSFRSLDASGTMIREFEYRKDFVEWARLPEARGDARGTIMGVAYGPTLEGEPIAQFGLGNSPAQDHVIIVRAEDLNKVSTSHVAAVLAVANDPGDLQRRDVYPYMQARFVAPRPVLVVSAAAADQLLRSAGSSLAELDALRSALTPGTMHVSDEGTQVEITVQADRSENMLDEAYVNVLGVIPGQGYMQGQDSQVIIVSAYYDGAGTDPLGTVYAGANDNASGVASMLEIARLLKTSAFQPDKTVLFAARTGGERQEGLSTTNIMNARPGAADLTVETVIELSGVGYGTGQAISIGNDSSYRLVQLFQQAARRYNAPTTTLGRGPHYDLPVASMFGGRKATTLSLSWDGSDDKVHTPDDTLALIDPVKLRAVGQSTYLTLLVLSREAEY